MKHIHLFLLILFSLGACHNKNNRERIGELMTELYRKGDFNGTILVAENGNIIYDTALGFANLMTKEPLEFHPIFTWHRFRSNLQPWPS